MSALAARYLERSEPAHLPRPLAIGPSERTIQATTAADRLRDFVDELCISYRLTPAERSVMLVGELARGARNDLSWERYSGNTAPLCNRFIKPASDDAAVAEAESLADGIDNAASEG